MLEQIKNVDTKVIDKMFLLYAESMEDMTEEFNSHAEMKEAYAAFLKDFIANQKQVVLVETVEGQWMSGLRAIESETGIWFIEAVETMPTQRNKGYGKMLLLHTIDYFKKINAKKLECIIGKSNVTSIKLHSDCGFHQTDELPVNCWGELEDGRLLFRLEI
ncbi:GNAT family N-acetyltransferase [Roseburia sp. MSJ-14]|uniref:GNAT family N-acetyltransferase n=1 Tax=Roseburia sp. MSJ-14 TaxID=2841514 RepID=UPI001C10FB75|nr:GNAT family N-acetyltransferase [Roseburia sp. MSJ-14]MBU5473711.1 GNAT family N-acetyltransferase [Roseburia sp. MSJ-14]